MGRADCNRRDSNRFSYISRSHVTIGLYKFRERAAMAAPAAIVIQQICTRIPSPERKWRPDQLRSGSARQASTGIFQDRPFPIESCV
jgi:hypothetical protein